MVSEVSNGANCPEVITRVYEVYDQCGNRAECTQVITIDEAISPTLTCPGLLTAVCSISERPPYANYIAFLAAGGNASDNCGINATSFTHVEDVSDGNSCPEVITRTYQIEDFCGNTATCTQLITIDDNINPTLTSPPNLTASCDISEQPAYASYAEFISAGGNASDNCGIVAGSFILVNEIEDGASCPKTYTRTYQISDLCGNTTTSTQNITILDVTPPIISCPPGLSAVCTLAEAAYTTLAEFQAAGGSVSDNCGINPASFALVNEIDNGLTCPKTITRTYRIADLCGNTATCDQEITINDLIAPTISCASKIKAACTISDVPPYATLAEFIADGGTASDNCGLNTSSFTMVSEVSDGKTCKEKIKRTYSIEDECGNSATCEQEIELDDKTDPTGTPPSSITVECETDIPTPFTSWAAFLAAGGSATDNCAIDTSTFVWDKDDDSGSCPYTITRTYKIEDLCGNDTKIDQIFIVDDQTPPTADALPDLGPYSCFDDIPHGDKDDVTGETDNCGGDVDVDFIGDDQTSGCSVNVTRTYRLTDECGNYTDITQTIIINDITPPTADPLPELGPFSCGIIPPANIDDVKHEEDDCDGDVVVTFIGDYGDPVCPDVIIRTYRLTDVCGNYADITQNFLVNDLINPTISCPPDVEVSCDISSVPAYTSLGEFIAAGGTASDNCGLNEASFSLISEVSDGETCEETITRTYRHRRCMWKFSNRNTNNYFS